MIAFGTIHSGPDKEAFHRYLTGFSAVEHEAELLDSLTDCTDVLPSRYADLLFLPPGSTYRDAVQLLVASWSSKSRSPDESAFE